MATREERLRGYTRALRDWDRPVPLPPAEMSRLQKLWEIGDEEKAAVLAMARGQWERGLKAIGRKSFDQAAAEWESIPLLAPQDKPLLEALLQTLDQTLDDAKAASWLAPLWERAASAYLAAGGKKSFLKSRGSKLASLKAPRVNPGVVSSSTEGAATRLPAMFLSPWFYVPVGAVLTGLLIAAGLFFFKPSPPRGPVPEMSVVRDREIPFSLDSKNLRHTLDSVKSELKISPETHYYQLSGVVNFPDAGVTRWEGALVLLDASKKVLARRPWNPVPPSESDPVRSIELFQQMDATGISSEVTEGFFETSVLEFVSFTREEGRTVQLIGNGGLSETFHPELVILRQTWQPTFAAKILSIRGQLINRGLKPIRHLMIEIQWPDRQDRLLRTAQVLVVSENRSALEPGGAFPFVSETEWPQEIFGDGIEHGPDPVYFIKEIE